MNFARDDGNYHVFWLPNSVWVAGGKLFFRAKTAIDDDLTDSSAIIEGQWSDSDIVGDDTYKTVSYKKYNCYFPPEATNKSQSNGAGSIDLLGEFQWVSPTGIPFTYPAYNTDKIPVTLYFDVDRETQ